MRSARSLPARWPTRPPGRRGRVGLAAVAAALLLAGCTGGGDQPDPAPSGSPTAAEVPESFCSGSLPGAAAVALLGPGRVRESGTPPLPRPGRLASQCALRSGDQNTTLALATAAAETTGRVTLQGIANNTPATAVPITTDGTGGSTGLVDPTFAWLTRPCTERRTLLTTLRLTTDTGTTPPQDAARRLATLLLAATERAAAAAECDQGATPTLTALPTAPTPARATGTTCGVPAAALTRVTGPLDGWTSTTSAAGPDAPARTCDLGGPGGATIRFVVSRGLVASNAGPLPPGSTVPVAGLAGATTGPSGARLDTTCKNSPVAYRLRLTNLPTDTPAADIGALFATAVRAAAATAGCPLR